MFKKLFTQAGARLEGEVAISSDMIYDLAEQVAPTIAVDGYVVRRGKADQDGQHFTVAREGKVVNSFCVWAGNDLIDEQDRPTGRRNVYAEWDDKVIDDIGQLSASAEHESTTAFFGKLLMKAVRGVPGSAAYKAFLQEYRRVLTEADGTARVEVL
jgi:hypothetical protein